MKYTLPILFICILGFIGYGAMAQQPPGTEIYLLDLKIKKNAVIATKPANISKHEGYDNQPFFHPVKNLLYYASANIEGRTDIKVYDYASGTTTNVTTTTEREYSPTVTPDGKFISCIIQRDNGEQNLGKYPIEGGEPIILIKNHLVGYHAWGDDNKLIAFILGEPMTLHFIDFTSDTDNVIADSPGRALHKIPNSKELSYMKQSNDAWAIYRFDPSTSASQQITQTRDGQNHDITWTPDGKILSSDGNSIYYFDTKSPGKGWIKVQLPVGFDKTITRMAVNAKGNKLAIVVSE